MDLYLEIGKKRTFAGALDWPGWCRGGRTEVDALRALFDSGSRYARVIGTARLGFQAPATASEFNVSERLEGNASTDFGAPAAAPASDARPIAAGDLERFQLLLPACWRAFDAATAAAAGKELRTGPRGGGRDLDRLIQHVLEGDGAYLAQVGWKLQPDHAADPDQALADTRQAVLDALAAAARGATPAGGPRGGRRWTARYFVRRVAWHVLDHAWELEDRVG